MDPNTQEKQKEDKIIKIIASVAFFLVFISCNTIAITTYLIIEQITNDQTNVHLTSIYDNAIARDYIDPDIDTESTELLVRAKENFLIEYQISDSQRSFKYETDLILANLQYRYEILTAKFSSEIPEKIIVTITNNQKLYENEFGFDFENELPYAGLTRSRSMMILINDNIFFDNSKQDLTYLLGHELVHIFQFEAFDDQLISYPLWFAEGTAEYFSGGPRSEIKDVEQIITLNNLDRLSAAFASGEKDKTRSAYLLSELFIDYLYTLMGEDEIYKLMIPKEPYQDFNEQFEFIYKQQPDKLFESWHMRLIEKNRMESSKSLDLVKVCYGIYFVNRDFSV